MNQLQKTLKQTVQAIARPEGRVVGTPGHRAARGFVAECLKEIGLEPYRGEAFELRYRRGGQNFTNLAGVIRGNNPRQAPVAVVAHYDSVIEAPCADDNAAAVAIALETARMLQGKELERDVLILIPDAEEPPYFQTEAMGSIRFYHEQMDSRGIHAALVMDLVGHNIEIPEDYLPNIPLLRDGITLPLLKDLVFMTGAESHSALKNLLENAPLYKKRPVVATLNKYVGDMSDHGVFIRNNVPYLFLSCGRWKHYHQPTDTPDRLAYDKMARITELVSELVEALCTVELKPETKPADTVALEIASLKNALGALYPLGLSFTGLKSLETRKDMDHVANLLLSTGL